MHLRRDSHGLRKEQSHSHGQDDKSRKGFDELRKQINATRRVVQTSRSTRPMLSELRRKLDLTQTIVVDRLDVTQEEHLPDRARRG
jgi:hypothetical protein